MRWSFLWSEFRSKNKGKLRGSQVSQHCLKSFFECAKCFKAGKRWQCYFSIFLSVFSGWEIQKIAPAVSTENPLGLFIPVLSLSFTFSSTDRSPVLIVNLNQLHIDPREV